MSGASSRTPVTLVMGRLPARTGGERYNVEVVGALGVPVRHVYVGLWQALTLVGLLPLVGPALAAVPISLALMFRRGLFVVDEHFAGTVALANWVRRLLGRGRMIAIVHHLEAPPTTPWRRAWQRWRLGMADRICTVSTANMRELVAAGLDPRRIHVIPPGCSSEGASGGRSLCSAETAHSGSTFTCASSGGGLPEAPVSPAHAPRPLRLLAVGGTSWRKGYDVLLRALALLDGPGVHLDIVGDPGPRWLRARLHRLAGRLSPRATVTFHAYVSERDLQALLAAADLFVWPSRREGYGIVLLEAMAAGLPIVAADTGAARELVAETGSGVVVPVDDVPALAAALGSLLASPSARAAHVRAGRAWIETAPIGWDRTRAAFIDLATNRK